MNKIVFFAFLLSAVVLISSAEPVQYRANQRVKPLQQQQLQQKPADNPDSENIEVTTVDPKNKSDNQSEKQQEEEVEEPKGKVEPTTESDESAPYVPSGWKPAGNLLVLPTNGGIFYIAPQPRVAPPTTTEAQETTESEGTTEGTTESATTESGTTEIGTTESATEDSTTEESGSTTEDDKFARTKVETTSEPDAESVDVETTEAPVNETPEIPQHEQPPSPTAVNTFFVQLSDGTFQRVVFVNAPATNLQAAPWTAALQAQPVLQPQPILQAQPYAFNSAYVAPKIVTYTSHYQSW